MEQDLEEMTNEEAEAYCCDWKEWARPNQIAPEWSWDLWFLCAGRGFGKTRTGAEWVISQAEALGKGGRIALVGRTAADVRDVMVEGESGILECSPSWFRPTYEPSKRGRLTWPNGCLGFSYSSEKPAIFRGPAHHKAWADELATWQHLVTALDNLLLGLRLGTHPQWVATTTPKPLKILKDLQADEGTALTTGSTYDNMENLSQVFKRTIIRRFEGTRLGRQELHAELMDEADGALWQHSDIEDNRTHKQPEMLRIVVAIDPAVTSGESSDDTGIVVAGLGRDQRGHILQDISGRYTPHQWAKKACDAYTEWEADMVIGEANNGGDLVEANLRTIDTGIPFRKVHASRGKQARAEPIASLYEQGRISHVGTFTELESEMCTWEPNSGMRSPSRLDAAVWALTELDIAHGVMSSEDLEAMESIHDDDGDTMGSRLEDKEW